MQPQPCDDQELLSQSYHTAATNCLCNVRRAMGTKRSFARRSSDKCH